MNVRVSLSAEDRVHILTHNSDCRVVDICRQHGISRTTYYQWKERFERGGIAAMADRRRGSTAHPNTTPAAVVEVVRQLALEHPEAGCGRLAQLLCAKGHALSAMTIQKILHKHELGTRADRWRALEAAVGRGETQPSDGQIEFIEKFNPCFRARSLSVTAPGERLSHGTFALTFLPGVGRVYINAVVDAYSAYVCARPSATIRFERAEMLIREDVIPFFKARGHRIGGLRLGRVHGRASDRVIARGEDPDGLSVCPIIRDDAESHPLQGFVERFRQDVIREFRHPLPGGSGPAALAEFARAFAAWIAWYNRERPFEGYPNYGLPPFRRF